MSQLRQAIDAALTAFTDATNIDHLVVTISERRLDAPDTPTGKQIPIDAFEARFAEILNAGARDWVNLQLESIDPTKVSFTLEHFSTPIGDRTYPPEQISINISGPQNLAPVPPILIFEDHDLLVFTSLSTARQGIEPQDVDDRSYLGFDSVGTALALTTQEHTQLGRITKRKRIVRRTLITTSRTNRCNELVRRIQDHIKIVGPDRFGIDDAALGTIGLKELVEALVRFHRI